jgi:hypothetical protein
MLLAAAAACTHNAARVTHELAPPGPIRVDRQRSVTVERINDDVVTVGLPVLADVEQFGGTAYVGSCTVRTVQVLGALERDNVVADAALAPLDPGRFLPVPASFDSLLAGGVRSGRVYFDTPLPIDTDTTVVRSNDRSIAVLVTGDPSRDTANRCSPGVPAPLPIRALPSYYLIDFELIRPVGGGVMGGGAFIVAAVGATVLMALAFGG